MIYFRDSSMVKILIVGVSNRVGGIETFFHGLFKEKSNLYNISFLTFSEKCAFEDEYLRNGYNVYHLPTRRSHPLKFSGSIKNFYKDHNDFDYIWVNTASMSMYELQYYGKKKTRAKIITHSHGIAIEKTSGALLYVLNNLLSKFNYRKVIKNTDLFFCCSQMAGLALFGKKYEKNLIVINNGIDTEKFRFNLAFRSEIRESLGINTESLVFAIVGRLSEVKNPFKAISVFEKLHKIHENSMLLIVGDGELMVDIKERIGSSGLEKNVKVLGLRQDVYKIMSAVDILLMPSMFEGFPLSAVEAQASGVMCMLSDTITKEVAVTDLVNFLSIKEDDEIWAKYIVQNYLVATHREQYAEKMQNLGYDKKDILSNLTLMLEREKKG